MISVCWDWEGLMHLQKLERNATVNKGLHSPATPCERGYSTEKAPLTRPNHTPSQQRQAPCCTSGKAALQKLEWEVLVGTTLGSTLGSTLDTKINLGQRITKNHLYNNNLYLFN
ncbi:hypothetical protein TNCV_3717921 [Trichonephila clavipes]|nr:hypothetical protein TNCV_3717921 [Trichonephila clavipes]